MSMPDEYDEYTVYVPHTQIVPDDGVTLDQILVAGYKAYGYDVKPSWIETDYRDTHGV